VPKLAERPLRRLHITVEEEDHEWLKQTLGTEGQISNTFRMIIKRLRDKKIAEPKLSVVEILERENLKEFI
jgi:hypothetical protein